MVMVGHEHVRIDAPSGFSARFGQGFEPALPILIVTDNGPPMIASGHHVIDRAGILNTQRPGHASSHKDISGRRQHRNVTILGPTLSRIWLNKLPAVFIWISVDDGLWFHF